MTSIVPTNIVDSVKSMDGTRRFYSLAGFLAAAGVVWMIVRWATTPTYVTLFPGTQLTLADAAEINDWLETEGIRREIDGTVVRVPVADVQSVRMQLAREQLGLGACGSSTEFSVGAGSVEQQIKRAQTIRSQLECTIQEMHGIEKAHVALTLREQTAFRRLGLPAKAAVTVWSRRGARLDSDMVASITYLVSSAVEGLAVEQVAVVDGTTGRPLSIPGDVSSPVARSVRELEARREVEEHLTAKAAQMLAPVLPPSEYRVQVAAELDWTAIQRTSEQFDPEAQAIMRQETSEVPAEATGPGSPPYNSEQLESRYSRTVENITTSPGSISRLSVAVFVNERAAIFGGDAGTPPDAAALAQQLARIEAVVRTAVAFDSSRGDQVVVNASPFWGAADTTAIATQTPSRPTIDFFAVGERLIRPIIGLLGIVVVLLIGLKAVKSTSGIAPQLQPGTQAAPLAPGDIAGLDEFQPSAQVAASTRLKNMVAKETDESPETTARVLRAWLGEPAT